MWGVLRFYNLVRSGITWRGPEVIELEYNDSMFNKQLINKQYKSYDFSSYQIQAKTTLTTATNNTLAKSYNECQHHHHNHHQQQQQHHHHKHYQNQRGRRQSAATQHKATIGCCAFFDIDDYDYDFDNDEDYDFEGDEYDCEGYYDDGDGDGEYYDDEDESSDCSMLGASPKRQHRRSERTHRVRNNNIRSVLVNKRHNKYKIAHPQTKLEVINESERSAGSGSDENDSLLVAYNSSSSLASVWHWPGCIGNARFKTESKVSDDNDDDDELYAITEYLREVVNEDITDKQPEQQYLPNAYNNWNESQRQRRRPLRRLYCCVNALIMAVLVTVEIYAQIVIFL